VFRDEGISFEVAPSGFRILVQPRRRRNPRD
jgi:hypothetical protein